MLFVDTEFVRTSGLGNRLFPWARSRIMARELGAQCIAPEWAHLRRGPILKGGINYLHAARKILLVDNFLHAPEDVGGLQRRWLRARLSAMPEAGFDTRCAESGSGTRVVFSGDGTHFRDLHGDHEFVVAQLRRIVKPKWQKLASTVPTDAIGLNIRLGRDFAQASSAQDFLTRGAIMTPVTWFVEALQFIRAVTGKCIPAIIVTDGTPDQLRPLLALPSVRHFETPAAASDLLALSRVRFLLGTGGSSFVAWASFLGRVPVLSIPGQSFNWFNLADEAHGLTVGELDPHEPSDSVRYALRNVFG